MPDSPPLVRPNTLKEFLKSVTDLRISEDAITGLSNRLTEVCLRVAGEAVKVAKGASRTTILKEDMEAAFATFLREAAPSLLGAAAIRGAIAGMPNDDLRSLIGLLKGDLEEKPS
jgi:histone H3/H4